MSPQVRKLADLIERAVATYVQVVIGLLLAGFADVQVVDRLSVLRTAAVAAIPAGLSVVKSGLAGLYGNKDSVSTLPASLDPATPKG